MQTLKNTIILLFLFIALPGCSKKPTLINGQIFVVTKGGENIKMGAVPVRVIPEEQFKEIARATVAAIEGQIASADEHRASIEAKKQLLQDLKAMEPQAALAVLIKQAEDEDSISGLRSPSWDAWMKTFVRALPQTQIKTDADGRFTAEVESKVWLVAGGQRRVGESSEEYLWVQAYQPPEKGMPQPVLISNADNVLFANEIHALIAPLVGKESALRENNQARPSAALVQWAAKIKEQALKLVAEAKAKAEAEQKERERMVAEAKAKSEAEQKERERMVAEAKAKAEAIKAAFVASNGGDTIALAPNVEMTVAYIGPGSFTMGSSSNEEAHSSDENQVEVTLSQSFWLAKTEVTQAQWEAVMGSHPSEFKGPNLPVENVSWGDAQAFIAKLNEKQILPQGWKFALPTEAQWEYACRAGEKGPYSGGSLDEVGWYAGNSDSKTHEVAQKKPNALGLYDMHGNVFEWCAEWYEDTLKGGADPAGPSSGGNRVNRGGSWFNYASRCRAAFRDWCLPDARYSWVGFRPALVPSR
jgi:formylglycine-generating enzyme required for sulfatase activity